jgi:hypothetical protein
MSLSCALWATSLHQWARRYIRLTQPARRSPEKRARMRAFYANGVDKMHVQWAVEGLPTLLHLSLFLFFGGLAIFLFNVDHEVFTCVVWWIGLFLVVYVLITILPSFLNDSPYYTPLSKLAWSSYTTIQCLSFGVLVPVTYWSGKYRTYRRCLRSFQRYLDRILIGMEKAAEKMASEQSSKVDIRVLDWTTSALGDDDSLQKFIEAIPGFFKSKLVNNIQVLPNDISRRLLNTLDGFWDRTWYSNSVTDTVKRHRLDIYLCARNLIPNAGVSSILSKISRDVHSQWLLTIEMGHNLACYCTSNDKDTAQYAQCIVVKILKTVRKRDDRWVELADRWVELAARVYGLPEPDLRHTIVTDIDDSVSLAILIQVTREVFRSNLPLSALSVFTQFDIRRTLSGLQHDFCTLWNEIFQEAKKQGSYSTPVHILQEIRHHYIALHQGTNAAPTAFSPSTYHHNGILLHPSSYPLCDIADHRPLPLPTQPVHSPDTPPGHSGRSIVSPEEPNPITRPPSSSRPSETGDGSPALAATSPALSVHTRPHSSDSSPPGAVFAAPQDIRAAATLSHPLEGTTQRDVVVSRTEPDTLFTAMTTPTPTMASVPASKQPVQNKSSESYDTGAASTSNSGPLPSSSSVTSFSFPTSPPQSCPPPPPIAESLALPSRATPPRPSGDAALSRLCVRGLVNTGSMCFANAVLQLLVHSTPFWTLFRGLGGLTGQRRVGGMETGSEATPLLDATTRFLEEFVFKEEPPPSHQEAAVGKMREDEDAMKAHNAVNSFEPMSIYDAMKEKRQLKYLLVRSRDKGALLLLIHAGLTCIGWPTA